MNQAERGELFLGIRRAYMFSGAVAEQLQRAYSLGSGEPFKLLALIEAAQELGLGVRLTPGDGMIRCDLSNVLGEPGRMLDGYQEIRQSNDADNNVDALLLALAAALGVAVPA